MSKNNLIFLTGSTGIIGKAIQNLETQFPYEYYPISAKSIFEKISNTTDYDSHKIFNFIKDDLIKLSKKYKIANIIFCHRIRNNDPLKALVSEFIISRDFVLFLNKYFKKINVTYVSSITGELIDRNSPEAYHYSKDLQKTISRYLTISNSNIKANVLSLSAFRKYSIENSSSEYTNLCKKYTEILGDIPLVRVENIAQEIVKFTIEINCIRGSNIPLDSGFTIIQH
jgi:hypothetical protein